MVTHTVPVDAYRGAGRPEATYSVERLVETAAREIGMDPAEFRRKNFIPPFDGVDEPGFQTNVALQYDSGNYEGVLDKALELADYESLKRNETRPKLMDVSWASVFPLTSKRAESPHLR